jgi:drug/metabolite transporter (DMT)-like permease
MGRAPTQSVGVLLYVGLCLVWGSTWLVIKVGYGGLGPFNVAGLRFLLAGAVLAVIVRLRGARWPQGRVEWSLVALVGLLMFGADYGLIYWAEQYLDSGLTAILFAVLPITTIVLAHFYVPGDRVTPRKLSGTMLALLGVVALFGDRVRLDASAAGPMLAVLLSTVCASVAGVAAKRHGTALHAASLNAPAMLLGGTVLMAASVLAGDGFGLPGDAATIGAITYLALAGSVATFLVYFSLLKTWSVTSLSFVAVFTPALALLLGFVFRDERPTIWTGLGAALILAGVTMALTAPGRAAPPAAGTP